MKDLKTAPPLVRKLCICHEAWIVGSALRCDQPKDWDVIVPFSRWRSACALIPPDAVPNTFGGWKCKSGESVVDVWPDDVADVLTTKACGGAWHPRSGTLLIKAE